LASSSDRDTRLHSPTDQVIAPRSALASMPA
jgi:hypothetical protein